MAGWGDVAASACPGLMTAMFGCPFDVIKTRMQTSSAEAFASPLHCLRWTMRNERVFALWKGISPMLLASTPYTVVVFGMYQCLRPSDGNLSGCFCAGAASGMAVTIPMNPIEVCRVQLQAANKNWKQVVPSLLKRPASLFRGMSMTAAVNVSGNAILFTANEALRAAFKKHQNFGLSEIIADAITGGLTGVIVKLSIYPADFIRSRLMVDASTGRPQDVVRNVLSNHGLRGLYRGASLVVCRGVAINATSWPLFHWVRREYTACTNE